MLAPDSFSSRHSPSVVGWAHADSARCLPAFRADLGGFCSLDRIAWAFGLATRDASDSAGGHPAHSARSGAPTGFVRVAHNATDLPAAAPHDGARP